MEMDGNSDDGVDNLLVTDCSRSVEIDRVGRKRLKLARHIEKDSADTT